MAFQVTKVNLPERTRARFETESNHQRVTKPHDIRSAIPLVDYTNPAKFPPYIHREYPKMPLLADNKPIVIDDSGGVLVFYDAADETEFKGLNPELAEEIENNAPTKALTDLVVSKDAEIENLRAQIRAAGLEAGAKKKPANALAAAVRPTPAKLAPTHAQPSEPTPEGMAAQIKQAEADQATSGNPKADRFKRKN